MDDRIKFLGEFWCLRSHGFFFQAEDGIRDRNVTGVQTCALPIFMEAHALAGCVAFESGTAAGYSFYVLEEQKGLIGGLYVSCKFAQEALGRRLLEEMQIGRASCRERV